MTMLYQWLDTVGDNTGNKRFVGDYSENITYAQITPPAGTYYLIHRLLVTIGDNKKFKDDGYGAMPKLEKGITLQLREGGNDVQEFTDNIPIQQHSDWASLCFNGEMITSKAFVARYTFTQAGRPLRLSGNTSDYLRIALHDNFSALTDHRFMVQGTQ